MHPISNEHPTRKKQTALDKYLPIKTSETINHPIAVQPEQLQCIRTNQNCENFNSEINNLAGQLTDIRLMTKKLENSDSNNIPEQASNPV